MSLYVIILSQGKMGEPKHRISKVPRRAHGKEYSRGRTDSREHHRSVCPRQYKSRRTIEDGTRGPQGSGRDTSQASGSEDRNWPKDEAEDYPRATLRPWIGRAYLEEKASSQSSPSPLSMVKGPESINSRARNAREADSIKALDSLVRSRKRAGFSRESVIRFITDKVNEAWERADIN